MFSNNFPTMCVGKNLAVRYTINGTTIMKQLNNFFSVCHAQLTQTRKIKKTPSKVWSDDAKYTKGKNIFILYLEI